MLQRFFKFEPFLVECQSVFSSLNRFLLNVTAFFNSEAVFAECNDVFLFHSEMGGFCMNS